MVTHTISDVLHGIIRFRREGITTGEFLLDKSITVANGDLINIVEDYTSDSGTNSKTIFHGKVTSVDYNKTQYVQAIDVADELDQVRPSGTYRGFTEVVMGEVINDASLANITCEQTSDTAILVPDGDVDVHFSWDDDNGNNDGVMFDDIDDGDSPNDGTYIQGANLANLELSLTTDVLNASVNNMIYQIDVIYRAKRPTVPQSGRVDARIYDGTSWSSYHTGDLLTDAFDTYTHSFTGLTLTNTDVPDFKVEILLAASASVQVSNLYFKIYHRYYPNLKKGTVVATYNFDGNSSIKEVIKTLSITELYTWYYDPDLELHFDDGATVSGEDMIAADKMKNIIGRRQVMSYDKVVLYGAYSGGSQITSTRGAGDIIWRDNYLNITEQAALDALADQILIEQGANTINIQMMRSDVTDGIYQVGETFAIADAVEIQFSNSDRLIPDDTTYIINKIDYIITNGVYNMLDIELIDGLLFTTPKNNTIGVVQDDTVNNSTGIAQVAGGESVGQANTGSNIGTDGVGVYDSKSGVTLQFRNIAPASGKITVVENGDDIDIDVGDIDSIIEGIITAELVEGESIDNAIDTLIAATDNINAAGARAAINNIIGSDGKIDAEIDFDGQRIINIQSANFKQNVACYILSRSTFSVNDDYHGQATLITTNGGSFGIPMYSDTTANRVSVCVDTSINTMPCIGLYISNSVILTEGTIRHDAWEFAIGKPVYVNGSVLSTTRPPDVGDVVQVVGVSITADSMFLRLSLDMVVRV